LKREPENISNISKKQPFKSHVPALEQGLQVLLLLQQHAGEKMSLTRICQGVGIHNSKGHYILATLHAYGFVEKDPLSKSYMLGARIIPLARTVIDHIDYKAASNPLVEELAKQTEATVWFGLRMNESLFVLSKYEGGNQFWATPGIGQTFDFFMGAHGKAMLAFLPDEERALLLRRYKGMTVSSDELALIKKTGFAKDSGAFAEGINAVAAPVFGAERRLIGVLLLFGTFSTDMLDTFGRKTADAAKRLSAKLGN
jgi:DNA-binding IclR family transcriptional regulator